MEWKAFAAASNVDPNLKTTCFAVVVLKFSGACLSPCVTAPAQETGRCSRTFFAWLVAVGFAQLLPSP